MKNAINFLIHAMTNETVACNVISMRYREQEKTTIRPLQDQYKTPIDKLKKLAALFALLFMVGVGSVWGAEEVVYTLEPASTGGNTTPHNNYSEAATITISSIEWSVTGNSNMVPWRLGGKSITSTDRTIYSNGTISNNVTKIVVTHGGASSITINSMTVIVSTAANGGGSIISTLTPTFAANGDVTIDRPTGADWTGRYYKIVYNVTVSGSNNKYLEFTRAKFYAETSGGDCNSITPSLSYTSTSLSVGDDSSAPTLTGNTGSGTVTWSSSDEDVATVSNTGVVTGVAAGSATITASIAANGGYCSGSASANFTITADCSSPTTYELVTDEDDLAIGDDIIILNTGTDKAMSTTQNTNNRGSVAKDLDGEWSITGDVAEVCSSSTVQVITLEKNGDYWLLHASNGSSQGYLYAASSSDNYLRTRATDEDANNRWTISIDGTSHEAVIQAQGSYTRDKIKNNGNLFSCYASGQTAIKIFKNSSNPVIAVSATLSEFTYVEGNGPSNSQTFTVSGKNLTGNLTVAAPTNYQISSNGSTWVTSLTLTPTTGTVSATTIYVRLKSGLTKADYDENITISGGGATSKTVALEGSVTRLSCATPTFSPAEGTYGTTQTVTISCATAGATIHYTIDGTDPTSSSPTYSSALSISSTTTVKAIAVKSGMDDSGIASATYTIAAVETYTLISDLSTVDPTDEVIYVRTSGTDYAMTNDNGTTHPNVVAVTISADGNTLTTDATNIQWNLVYSSGTFELYPAGETSTWLYCTNANDGVKVGTGEAKTFSILDDYLFNDGQSRYIGVYNNTDWRCYTSTSTNISDQEFAFYGRSAGTKYDVSASVSGGHGSVSLSSDKILETTGTVTITCVPDEGYAVTGTPSATNGTITKQADNVYELTGVTANTSVTVTYHALKEITVTTDGHGSAELSKRFVESGESVTLTLTPSEGYGNPITVTKTSGTATVGSVSEGSCTISGITTDVALSVTFTKLPAYTVTFNAGTGTVGGLSTKDIQESFRGNGVTAPSAVPSASCSDDWIFAYWSTVNQTSEVTDAPAKAVNAGDKYMPASDNITLYAIYRRTGEGGVETTTTDEITYSTIGVSGTNYADWSNKTASSSAVYAGNTAGGNSAIQMRSNNTTSGIISTTSGGLLKSVSITWNSNSQSGRELQVFGSNTAYTAASELYAAGTQGTLLGTITNGSSTSITDINTDAGEYAYIGIRSKSGAFYLDEIDVTWIASSTATLYYWTSPTCTACTEATHKFASPTVSLTYPRTGTYTNPFTTNNGGTPAYKSSDKTVATVTNDGAVTIVGLGTTTISVHIGKTGDKCAVDDSYVITVRKPTIDVVEVTDDNKIILEHDFGGTTNISIDQLVTKENGQLAEEVFFSKYFEASGNVKLLALYNGTGKSQDPTKLRIRIVNHDGSAQHIVYLSNHLTKTDMPDGKEIILYSYSTAANATSDAAIMDCVEGKENSGLIDRSDWICIPWSVYSSTSQTITFGGGEVIVLEQTNDGGDSWEIMDIIGALSSDGTKADHANIKKNTGSGSKQISWGDNGTSSNPAYGWLCTNGRELGGDDTDYPLSTLRCLLVRKSDVVSGAKARNTTTGNYGTGNFNTLCSEWYGEHVDYSNANTSSCNSFTKVGSFDYYSSYQQYESLSTSYYTATPQADGTMQVTINSPYSLADLACKFLKISVTKQNSVDPLKTDTLTSLEYRVPIIVSALNTQTDDNTLFPNSKYDGAEGCSLCDVVILKGASLKSVTGGKNSLHNIEVYRGAKLEVPDGQTLTINDLIMRSCYDTVPQANIVGNLNCFADNLFFEKRVDENQFYWITLPYNCKMEDVTLTSGEQPTYGNGKDWVLYTYNGVKRANTQAGGCWDEVPENSTLIAGKGYILGVTPKTGHEFVELRFPMTATAWDKDRATIGVPVKGTKGTSDGVAVNHIGWNLVGNPYLTDYAPGHIGETTAGTTSSNIIPEGLLVEGNPFTYSGTVRYVNIPQGGGYSEYSQIAIGSQVLPPFMSYFVQINGTDGETYNVQFSNSLDQYAPSPVRRRMPAAEDDHIVWVPFNLTNSNGETDETTLLVSNRFTDGYDMMDDLVKWRGDYYQYSVITTKPVLATRNATEELAFNALPDNSAAVTGVPVNFFAAYDGEYTFSINGKYGLDEVKEAQLWDATTQQYYDLLAEDYSFTSSRGNNTERFTLFVRVERKEEPEIATGNDNILADGKLGLMAIDQTLVLSGLTNDADVYVYDISGKLMISDHVSGNSIWRTTVPATGVYFVRVNGANGQQTLRTIVK